MLRHSAIAHFLADVAPTKGASGAFSPELVDRALSAACEVGASDLHLQPTAEGLELRWRVDGVLQSVGVLPAAMAPNFVARLKVLADLLTYRTDAPQEGRLRGVPGLENVEMRLSTFPTLHGEKGVVRFFGARRSYQRLADLGLPAEIAARLAELLNETSGALLVTGPAGGGKTTTLYACLRELAASSGGMRSLASLEDPIEVEVPGVAQSQTNDKAGFDLATGLRFLLRQDPEVILVGEIRDRVTAEVAFQAALTGHLVLSSFHAGSAAGAISRLSDMGIEPYLLRSGVLAILCQRLVRRLCDCARPNESADELLGLRVSGARLPVGCDACRGTGYAGRMVLAEMLTIDRNALARAVLSRTDAAQLDELAVAGGMVSRWQRACDAVEAGLTSPAEVRRVLGFSEPGRSAP
ncbi:MAG: type II/IV secretion system protein [Pirellulales bacterium]|nr:type II/IV secretion system protein [Pirellulales bacterium]